MRIELNSFIDKLPKLTVKEKNIEWRMVLIIFFFFILFALILFSIFDFFPKERKEAATCDLACDGGTLDPINCVCVPYADSDACTCSSSRVIESGCGSGTSPVCVSPNTCACNLNTPIPTPTVFITPTTPPGNTSLPNTLTPTPLSNPTTTQVVFTPTVTVANTNTAIYPTATIVNITTQPSLPNVSEKSCLDDPNQSKCNVTVEIINVQKTPDKITQSSLICWNTLIPTKGFVAFGIIKENRGIYSKTTSIETEYLLDHCINLTELKVAESYVFKITSISPVGSMAEYENTFAFEPSQILALPETGECITVNNNDLLIKDEIITINYTTETKNYCKLMYDYENINNALKYFADTTFSIPFYSSIIDLNNIPYESDVYYSIQCSNNAITEDYTITADNDCIINGLVGFDLFKTYHPDYIVSRVKNDLSNDNDFLGLMRSFIKIYNRFPLALQIIFCISPSTLGIIFVIIRILKRRQEFKSQDEIKNRY